MTTINYSLPASKHPRRTLRRGIVSIPAACVALAMAALGAGSAQAQTTTTFSTSGNATWTCPVGVTSVQVEAWGAGGGSGGAGANFASTGGGAGGSYVKAPSVTVSPGTTYQLTVGSSGTAGLGGSVAGTAGGAGGSSYFGNTTAGNSSGALILAAGGAGSVGNNSTGTSTTNRTATNGATASNTGDVGSGTTANFAGTSGANAVTNSNNSGAGGAGAGASGSSGGGAGGAALTSAGNGKAGTAPGGGGGGADQSSSNGNGAGAAGGAGQIALTYTTSSPVINTSGTANLVYTTQGSASAPTSFSASGANMTANIIITPPAGFEVSTTSSSSGFASSGTLVPSAGTVNSTTIYVRLAAADAAGVYSGNVSLASTAATTVNVAIPSSTVMAPFTAGNVVVQQADNGSTQNTTVTMLELSTSGSQVSPVQSFSLPGNNYNSSATLSQALRINGSGGTTGYLATSNDGTLLAVVDANALSTGDIGQSTAASILNRAVASLNASGNLVFQTYYTGATGNQSRAATSLDNVNWFVADKGGIYVTNSGTPASTPDSTANMLVTKSFGGQVYGFSATAPGVTGVTLSGTGIGQLNTLTGLSVASYTDFYLISSGVNGSAYDVCYVALGTSTSAGTINKYSLVSGTWVSSGSYNTNFGGRSIIASGSGGGAVLYLTGGDGGHSGVSVVKLTDAAPWNSPINITTANNVNLYTFASGASGPIPKGIAFAPTATALPDLTVAVSVPATSSNSFNYTLTVANSGAANATGVTAQFTLPAGLTYVSATDNGGNGFSASNSSGVITFTGGTLLSGSSDTITVAVTGVSNATYTVDSGSSPATGHGFATINTSASTGSPIAESNTANNSSAVSAATTTVSASINTSGSPVALSTTYGTASTTTSFLASGVGLTANIIITPPAGFEVSTTGAGSGFASSGTLVPSSGSVASTTVYVRLAATTAAGSYSGNINLASTGTPSQNVAIPSSAVSQLALTVSGAAVTTKPWDGTTAATITGSLVGVVNGDLITLNGTGTFASSSDGTGIAVTSTSTLSGAGAGNYTLTQPTGLTGTILASANLSNLALSAGNLTVPFAFGTTSYSSYVPNNTSSLTLTPTGDTGATITVNGSPATTPVTLHSGSNTINVVVTPNGGGSTQTYTVTVFVAGPFTQGDLVVTTYGNTAPATVHPDNAPTLITLEEFTPSITTNSTPVMATVLPSTVSGNNAGIIGEYGSSSEGTIQLTDDGQHLTIGGYSAIPGLAYTATATAQSPDTVVPRVAALIDVNGNVDTTSVFNDIYNTNNPRCVYSPDDITLYLSGQGAGASDEGGLYYTHLGTNTTTGGAAPTGIFNVVSTRTMFAYQGNLYYSADQNSASKGTQTGIFEYSGVPTTSQSTNTGTRITPANDGGSINYSPDGFFFANSTTLYVADTGDPKAGGTGDGGIQKWVYNGSAWVLQYTLTTPNFVPASQATTVAHGETGFASLSGTVISGTAYLYTTSYTAGDADADGLYGVADTVSSTTGAGETVTEIAAAPGIQSSGSNPDYVFKGVSFAPIAAPVNSTIATNSVHSTVATLTGSFNPNGSDAHVYFQYGTTTAYGMTTSSVDLGSGNSPVAFSIPLTGLSPGTTYDYRLVSDGVTVYYSNETFTTPASDVPAMPPQALAMLAAGLAGAAAWSLRRQKRDSAS